MASFTFDDLEVAQLFVDFDKVFNPTPGEATEQVRVLLELHEKLAKEKSCITCRNCVRVTSLPGFVTGEEHECAVGLECDTVLNTVKNCPKYDKREIDFLRKELNIYA